MQKKENAKVREEIEFYQRVIQERREDLGEDEEANPDEEIDMEGNEMDAESNAIGMQSKMSGKGRDMSGVNKRSQLNTRGTNRSSSNVAGMM